MQLSLKHAFDLFIFDRESYCEVNTTVRNYKCRLKYFIDFMESLKETSSDKIFLNDIQIDDLKSYVIFLRGKEKLDNHPFKPTEHKTITRTSIRSYSIDLRTFFNFLYKNDYIENDLMKKFTIIKGETKIVVPLFAQEVASIDNLFNKKTETGLRNLCIIHLMLDEGLRSGDVVGLKTSSIDFENNHLVIYDGKGAKDRIVPLASNLKKYLYQYKVLYKKYSFDDYFFISVNGSSAPISANTIKMLFARIRKKTGLERLKPHLLRHTFATSYILGGGDLETLRIFLGHASYEITQNYLHIAQTYRAMGSDIYRLDKIFFKRGY